MIYYCAPQAPIFRNYAHAGLKEFINKVLRKRAEINRAKATPLRWPVFRIRGIETPFRITEIISGPWVNYVVYIRIILASFEILKDSSLKPSPSSAGLCKDYSWLCLAGWLGWLGRLGRLGPGGAPGWHRRGEALM